MISTIARRNVDNKKIHKKNKKYNVEWTNMRNKK